MAKWEIEKSLKAIREAIAEFYADYDQTYKMSCFGQEEIRGLKRREVELLRLSLAWKKLKGTRMEG